MPYIHFFTLYCTHTHTLSLTHSVTHSGTDKARDDNKTAAYSGTATYHSTDKCDDRLSLMLALTNVQATLLCFACFVCFFVLFFVVFVCVCGGGGGGGSDCHILWY